MLDGRRREGGRSRTKRGAHCAISIVIDVKPVGVVDDLSPAMRHICGYRLPCFFPHSSCFSSNLPSSKGERNDDDDDDVRVLDARGRWISILSSLTSRHLDRRLDLITGRIR